MSFPSVVNSLLLFDLFPLHSVVMEGANEAQTCYPAAVLTLWVRQEGLWPVTHMQHYQVRAKHRAGGGPR